jgi:hypothetical protein
VLALACLERAGLCVRGHGVQLGCTVVVYMMWVGGVWVRVKANLCLQHLLS